MKWRGNSRTENLERAKIKTFIIIYLALYEQFNIVVMVFLLQHRVVQKKRYFFFGFFLVLFGRHVFPVYNNTLQRKNNTFSIMWQELGTVKVKSNGPHSRSNICANYLYVEAVYFKYFQSKHNALTRSLFSIKSCLHTINRAMCIKFMNNCRDFA